MAAERKPQAVCVDIAIPRAQAEEPGAAQEDDEAPQLRAAAAAAAAAESPADHEQELPEVRGRSALAYGPLYAPCAPGGCVRACVRV